MVNWHRPSRVMKVVLSLTSSKYSKLKCFAPYRALKVLHVREGVRVRFSYLVELAVIHTEAETFFLPERQGWSKESQRLTTP